ncbi:hypothetical protein KM043_016183 [Ampulex compressa]|nr:hypothetical protein KM043_016183 [Ampulex compressa]
MKERVFSRMQQASVGGCDGDSGAVSPRSGSPQNFAIKREIQNDRHLADNDARVKVKLEVSESADSFEVKREPHEDYHQQQHHHRHQSKDFHYERKAGCVSTKPEVAPDVPNQCQAQHHQVGYRAMSGGMTNSFGFPHFYGHPPMLPPSFPGGRPSPDRSMGKIEDHEHGQPHDRHAGYRIPSNDGFFYEHHRFEDFHHGKSPAYPGVPFPGFRPPMQQRLPYGNHQNNSGYRSGHYQGRQRKWSGTALRGLHPPMPWPTWFFRPDFPLGASLSTCHVSNPSNVPTSSPLPSRTHSELPKAPESPLDGSKVHGQTPTICTEFKLKYKNAESRTNVKRSDIITPVPFPIAFFRIQGNIDDLHEASLRVERLPDAGHNRQTARSSRRRHRGPPKTDNRRLITG